MPQAAKAYRTELRESYVLFSMLKELSEHKRTLSVALVLPVIVLLALEAVRPRRHM